MADQLQLRGGTTNEHSTFTGALREVTVDTDKDTLIVHDAATAGGHPLLREDGSNSALSLGTAGTPSIKFTGDTNTGIYSPGADQVAISTGGSARLYINSSGQVGVGTTSPAVLFEANLGATGTIARFRGADTDLLNIDGDSNQITLDARNVSALAFEMQGSEALRIDSSGRVGVGTSSPGSYHSNADDLVISTTANTGLTIATGTTNTGSIFFSDGTSGADAYRGIVEYSHSGNSLGFFTNATRAMTIDSSQRVGVGTTSPTYLCNVLAASGSQNIFQAGQTGVSNGYTITSNGTNLTHAWFNGGSEAARIDSSGRLGIGTSSPGHKVEIAGTSGSAVLGLLESGVRSWGIRAGGAVTNAFDIADFTAGATRLTIDSSGRVGIGTTSPSALLHVDGSAIVGDSTFGTASQVTVYGNTGSVKKDSLLVLNASATVSGRGAGISIGDSSTAIGSLYVNRGATAGTGNTYLESESNIVFLPNNSTAATLDSSGRLLVGTSSARTVEYTPGNGGTPKLQVEGNDGGTSQILITDTRLDGRNPQLAFAKTRNGAIVTSGDLLGSIAFFGDDGTDTRTWGGRITCEVDGTPGVNDMPGRLVFSTTADGASSPTERMRIAQDGFISFGGDTDTGISYIAANTLGFTSGGTERFRITSTGNVFFHTNGASPSVSDGIQISPSGYIFASVSGGPAGYFNRNTSDGSVLEFRRSNATVGSVSVTTTATAYNTSSDYRLKENVTPVTDGITRLQQLKPSRFSFIADPDTVVDGFIAHEVQTVIPEAITGDKDAVDDEGNPVYQGIDQSKLVPLLTAALQEAIGEIESLKARVAALEAN